MKQEQWKKIEELFNSALEIEPGRREAYLKEKCGGDKALYNDVLSLLNEDEDIHDLLGEKTPGIDIRNLTQNKFADRLIGKTLGEYTVDRVIASGGMGTVYLAHRSDGAFEQEVAVKVIHFSLSSATFVERFRQERQILARLNHANIARLLDGGVTEDGLPFLVMEMVGGKPLNEYIDQHTLSIDDKLKLFLQICEAVNYAHNHLIVHRDLKPGNIFVSESGDVKLLDFGIAKVFESEDSDLVIKTITHNENAPFTPEYAAPEQINGEEISTATDVYALGVILYELLTGSRPYEFKTKQISEIQQVISDNIPSRPSTAIVQKSSKNSDRLQISQIRRKLRGDLDNICLKALKKEQDRRYSNVEQFRNDIQRHLNGLPVKASGDFLIYRLKKHIHRHKLGVSFSAAFLLIISTIVIFYTAQLRRQTIEARDEAAKAKAVSEFLGSLFEAAGPEESRGRTVTAQELLSAGAERVETELAEVPDVQATMFNVIGDVYRRIAEYDIAETLMLKAREKYQDMYGEESEETVISLANLGLLYLEKGNFEKSEDYIDKAIGLINKITHINPETRADIFSTKAQLAFEQDNITLSDSLYRICQEIYTDKYGAEHPLVAEMLNARAMVARNMGDYDTAEQLYRKALDMRRMLLGDDHPDVAHTLNHLGRLMYQMGKYEEAEKFTRQGLALREKIFGDTSPETGASMSNLAHILTKMGKLDEAADYYRKVMDMMRSIYTEPHPYKAITTINYGSALYWLGQFDKAETFLRSGYKQMDDVLPPDHIRRTGGMIALANLLIEKQKYAEALPLLKKAWEIHINGKPDSDSDAAEAENALGFCLLKMGDEAEGRQHLDHSYQILKNNTNELDPSVVQVKRRYSEFRDNQFSMK